MPTTSLVVYEGPSLIDGEPIVVIATGFGRKSHNPKTGAMVQTWILRQDVSPLDALASGADKSVCGGCKHRPANRGSCYVNVFQAPQNVWRAYQRGRYPRVTLEEVREQCAGRAVRLGAYGDPAAVPIAVWDAMVAKAASYTGYTHQWRSPKFTAVLLYCQASVDSPEEFAAARARGFGTFRVKPVGDTAVLPGEVGCPASLELGHQTTCASCGICAGLSRGTPALVTIQAHGNRKRRFVRFSGAATV